jgi:hypothetical protein
MDEDWLDWIAAVGRAETEGRCAGCGTRLRRTRTYTLTCDLICHRAWLAQVIARLGPTKRITSLETGKTHLVPTRDLLEKGIRGADLPRYPEAPAA